MKHPQKEIHKTLQKYLPKFAQSIELFDIFESKQWGPEFQSYAFALKYQDQARTLSDIEVNQLHQNFCKKIVETLDVQIR